MLLEEDSNISTKKKRRRLKLLKQKKRELRQKLGYKTGLTPYQGISRVFGKFKCSHCKDENGNSRKWSSAYSWADIYQ